MKNQKKIFLCYAVSFIILFLCFILAVCVGAEKLNIVSVLKSIFNFDENVGAKDFSKIIFFKLRLPRALLVLMTGIMQNIEYCYLKFQALMILMITLLN